MSEFSDMAIESFRESLDVIGETFKIGSTHIVGVPSENEGNSSASVAGFDRSDDASVTFAEDDIISCGYTVSSLPGAIITRMRDSRQFRAGDQIVEDGGGLVTVSLINPSEAGS